MTTDNGGNNARADGVFEADPFLPNLIPATPFAMVPGGNTNSIQIRTLGAANQCIYEFQVQGFCLVMGAAVPEEASTSTRPPPRRPVHTAPAALPCLLLLTDSCSHTHTCAAHASDKLHHRCGTRRVGVHLQRSGTHRRAGSSGGAGSAGGGGASAGMNPAPVRCGEKPAFLTAHMLNATLAYMWHSMGDWVRYCVTVRAR